MRINKIDYLYLQEKFSYQLYMKCPKKITRELRTRMFSYGPEEPYV